MIECCPVLDPHYGSYHGHYNETKTHSIAYTQMTGIAAANELNNRQRFRGFFRTAASSEFVGAALAEMSRVFNWTQMAIISQSESLFSMVSE